MVKLSRFLSVDLYDVDVSDAMQEYDSALQFSVRKYLLHMEVKETQYLLLNTNQPFHSSGAKYKSANGVELLTEMGGVVAYVRDRYAGGNRNTQKTVIDSISRYVKASHFDSSKFSIVSDSRKGGFSIIAKRDLLAGDILFTESCICCVAGDVHRPNCCHHCSTFIGNEYLSCNQCTCGEVYCSEECLEVAKLQYHDALCGHDYYSNTNFLALPGQIITDQKVIYAVIKLVGMTLMKEKRLQTTQHFSPLDLPLFRHLSSLFDFRTVLDDPHGFLMSEGLMPHQVTLKLHNLLSQQLGHLCTDNPYFNVERKHGI